MSISNNSYLQALEKTKNIYGDSPLGFVSEGASTTASLKQGNTIIQLLIQLDTKLGVIEERLKTIESKVGAPSSSGLSKSIEDLTERISRLKTGETKKTQERGTLKVVKNPFELLKAIK